VDDPCKMLIKDFLSSFLSRELDGEPSQYAIIII